MQILSIDYGLGCLIRKMAFLRCDSARRITLSKATLAVFLNSHSRMIELPAREMISQDRLLRKMEDLRQKAFPVFAHRSFSAERNF